jgi:MYXO-CTERM domain-containing protein
MTKAKRRVIAASVVLAFAGVSAIAAGGPNDPFFTPSAVVVPLILNTPMTNQTTFVTPSTAAPLSIASIDPMNCLAGITATPNSFNVPAGGGSNPITVTCPAIPQYRIERCKFQAVENTGSGSAVRATLTALCHVQGGATFIKSTDLTFTNVPINSASAPQTTMITSADGITGISLQIADDEGNFEIVAPCVPANVPGCDATLAIGPPASLPISVRCTPKRAGPLTALLYAVDHATGRYLNNPVMLTCTTMGSTGGTQEIDVSPMSVSQTWPVGQTSGTDMITIQNLSLSDPLTISGIAIAGSADWSVALDMTCPMTGCTIAPGTSKTIAVNLTPSTVGPGITKQITITSNDPDEPSTIVMLMGEGTDPTAGDGLSANPPMIGLGEVRIDRGKTGMSTLSVTGTNPVWINSVDLQNNLAGATTNTNGQLVTTSQTVQLSVTHMPATEGPFQDAVVVDAVTGASQVRTIVVPFSGVAVRAEATAPAQVNAGSFCIDQPLQSVEVVMESTGTGTFDMVGKPVLEKPASAFELQYTQPLESEYPKPLAPDELAKVAVRLRTPAVMGKYTDKILWNTDLDVDPMTTIDAEVIDDGGAISPMRIDFLPQPVRLPAEPRTITLQNCGAEPLTLGALTIDNDEFRNVTTTALPASLPPLGTATLLVDFTPRGVGVRDAVLRIESSKGPLIVELFGAGVAGTLGDGSRASLYACSCASGGDDPVGGIVILLALVAPLVPRRRRR